MMALPWLDVLDETVRTCAAYDRPDLVRRLRMRRTALAEPKVRILVLGEPCQGKSQLVNGLLGAPLCAVGDDITTTVPTFVEHAPSPAGALITGGTTPAIEAGVDTDRVPIPVESVTEQANRRSGVVRAEIGLPRAILATGLALIDTPPVESEFSQSPSATLSLLPQVDAVLLVSDATRELSPTELRLLERITPWCPAVVVVLTKIDLVSDWVRIAERNRSRLAHIGLSASVLPVSATLRLAAVRSGDRALNEESGYAALVSYLHHDLVGQADQLRRRSVAALTRLTVDQLIGPLREQLAEAQRDGIDELTARWRAAGRRLEELQRESTRWQTVLSDEIADLTADLDFDLRDRTRRILREADEYFEVADPVKAWPEFEQWLRQNLRAVAEANSTWLLDRVEWIARKLANQIAPHRFGVFTPDELFTGLRENDIGDLRMPTVERFTIGQKLFVGMRGSYGGLLMFGLATTLAGMDLINPVSIGAGVAFGAKSVLEERGNKLKRRQSTARTAAHRHVDDFFLTYGKQSKDATRLIHRELRDRCTAVTHELQTEIADAGKRIKQIIDAESEQRGARIRQLESDIDQLRRLHRRGQALAPAEARPGLTA